VARSTRAKQLEIRTADKKDKVTFGAGSYQSPSVVLIQAG
jgi:hypothetical protein